MKKSKVAIIGMGAYYPGASNLKDLWENILTRRQQFRRMPDCRLPLDEYQSFDKSETDKMYGTRAAVIDGFQFDWKKYRIPFKTFNNTDIVHWLTLDTAIKALVDSGYDKETIEKMKTGVVVGNSVTGEFTRSNILRLRWPYVEKTFLKASIDSGIPKSQIQQVLDLFKGYYKESFHAANEDTLAGGLSNTIAGRVANFLDLHGGGYTIDGACSSSLLAIINAARSVADGHFDMAFAGGVDVSLDPFELVGFSRAGALTREEMRVYDKKGKGFIPGEGCGIVLLKRYEDALRDGDKVYAVIDGTGISSDGKGGIMAPSIEQQATALGRALEESGLKKQDIRFIEGHGTGTALGDKVELSAIEKVYGQDLQENQLRKVGVTSFKSICGHTKAAAGVGAFIKTVMSLNQRVIPPTAGFLDPNPVLLDHSTTLYPVQQGEVLGKNSKMSAGVSAMGFGGINTHVILSVDEEIQKIEGLIEKGISEEELMAAHQNSEFFLISAKEKIELEKKLDEVSRVAHKISYSELRDYSFELTTKVEQSDEFKCAIIASTPFSLRDKSNEAKELLKDIKSQSDAKNRDESILLTTKTNKSEIVLLFPGQSSQKVGMGRMLYQRYGWAKDIARTFSKKMKEKGINDFLDVLFPETEKTYSKSFMDEWNNKIKDTKYAQPAVILCSLMWLEYLKNIGVDYSFTAGHSLGEISAIYAASKKGDLRLEDIAEIVVNRGISMAETKTQGTMLYVGEDYETVKSIEAEFKSEDFVLANLNSKKEFIFSGSVKKINQVKAILDERKIRNKEINVSNAFHSPLMEEASLKMKSLNSFPSKIGFAKDFISGISKYGVKKGKEIDLSSYLGQQILEKVDFLNISQVLGGKESLLIEVGNGRILSNLYKTNTEKDNVINTEMMENDDLTLSLLISKLFLNNQILDFSQVFEGRFVKPFIEADKKSFITNPCETKHQFINFEKVEVASSIRPVALNFGIRRALEDNQKEIFDFLENKIFGKEQTLQEIKEVSIVKEEKKIGNTKKEGKIDLAKEILKIISSFTGFELEEEDYALKIMDDLNLDSIKSGELISEIFSSAKITDLNPVEYNNASIKELLELVAVKEESLPASSLNSAKEEKKSRIDVLGLINEMTGFEIAEEDFSLQIMDGLNLDSIKAGELVSEVFKLGAIDDKNPADFYNATIKELLDLAGSSAKTTEKFKKVENVESFNANYQIIQETESKLNITESTQNRDFIIIKFGENIESLKLTGKNVIIKDSNENFDQLKDHVAQSYQLVRILKQNPLSISLISSRYIPYGDDFQEIKGIPSFAGTTSFMATSSLENPHIKFRMVKVEEGIENEKMKEIISQEICSKEKFVASRYKNGIRYELNPVSVQLENFEKKPVNISSDDTIFVIGGGKGITFHCALEFAKKYGNKLALIGRSQRKIGNKSDELEINLKTLESNNISYYYHACDVANKEQLLIAVEESEKALGPISGVIHGAGLNRPKRTTETLEEDACFEVTPKVQGLLNIMELRGEKLKFVSAFTSVIGVSGMYGNAWYAYSNEVVNTILNKYKNCRRLAYAYTVWGDVGMGAKLGSDKALGKMGISALSLAEGVKSFIDIFESNLPKPQIIITKGLGTLHTWVEKSKAIKNDPKKGIFSDKISKDESKNKLTLEFDLTVENHTFVKDHLYNGTYLMPMVFGVEAMAEGAFELLGLDKTKKAIIENLELNRPIIVPKEGKETVEIVAVKKSSNKAIVTLGKKGQKSYCFKGEVSFTKEILSQASIKLNLEDYKEIDLRKEDYYKENLLFQGPSFQRIEKVFVHKQDKDKLLFKVQKKDDDKNIKAAFKNSSELSNRELILNDSYVRDCMLQTTLLRVPKSSALPVRIGKIEISLEEKKEDLTYVINDFQKKENKDIIADVYRFQENGELVESFTNYVAKEIREINENPSFEELIHFNELDDEKLKRVWNEIKIKEVPNSDLNLNLMYCRDMHSLSKNERHELQKNHLQRIISVKYLESLSTGFSLMWEHGKPNINSEDKGLADLNLSISHDDRITLYAYGELNNGVDITDVKPFGKEKWEKILRGYNIISEIPSEVKKQFSTDETYSIIWAVHEAFYKLTQKKEKVSFLSAHDDYLIFNHGETRILVFTFSPSLVGKRVVALAFKSINDSDPRPRSTKDLFEKYQEKIEEIGGKVLEEEGAKRFLFKFPLTFKLNSSTRASIGYYEFANISGQMREFGIWPILQQVTEDFQKNQNGAVTNSSDLKIFGEAFTGEILECVVTPFIDKNSPTVTIQMDYYRGKYQKGGHQNLIARMSQKTTMVKILGHGLVKPIDNPDYFDKYMKDFAQAKEVNNQNVFPKSIDSTMFSHLWKNHKNGDVKFSYKRPTYKENLFEREYSTTRVESNTVGNIYYANYTSWFAKTLDQFTQQNREIFGENDFIPLSLSINHMKEAMPFDKVKVVLNIKEIRESSLVLVADFYLGSDKLARAEMGAAFTKPTDLNLYSSETFPFEILTSENKIPMTM